MKLAKRREAIASYALNYGNSGISTDKIMYKINEDPLWGMIEKKVGSGFSPLAWGSEFSQSDIDNGLIYYHYYGGDQNDRVDYLGFEVTDDKDESVTEKLEMEIDILGDESEILYQNYNDDNIRTVLKIFDYVQKSRFQNTIFGQIILSKIEIFPKT